MSNYRRDNGEIQFRLIKHIGVIAEYSSGWRKELNIVEWMNGAVPKYDIRDWNPEHDRMTRGITLYPEELESLKRILNECDLHEDKAGYHDV